VQEIGTAPFDLPTSTNHGAASQTGLGLGTYREGTSFYQSLVLPTAGNSNMIAQRGVLVVHHNGVTSEGLRQNERLLNIVPLDRAIEEYDATQHVRLEKLVVPTALASEVLFLLAVDGMHGAALFPGFDGVRRAVGEQLRWRRPNGHPRDVYLDLLTLL
jgi:hypothetical protein